MTLHLYAVENFVGSGELAACTQTLDILRPAPFVLLGTADAGERELKDGDRVQLRTELAEISLPLRVEPSLPAGIALVPRLRGTALEVYVPGRGHLECQIRAEESHG